MATNQGEQLPLLHEENRNLSDSFIPACHVIGQEVLGDNELLQSSSHYIEEINTLDNPVAFALRKCEKAVIRPYKKLLLVVGWQRVFEDPASCWQRVINWVPPLFVIILVLMGYIIQVDACFRRSGFSFLQDAVGPPHCQSVIISQYIIPDILHSVAYVYSFYLLMFAEREQLPTLMQRVFLQTSPTQTGFLSQGRLIRTMRALLYVCVCYMFLSLAGQILHIVSEYPQIQFSWFSPRTEGGRVVLLGFMLLGFVALDVVYLAVVINYCVQCVLIIFYIEGIQQRIRQCDLTLRSVVREINEIQQRLTLLNYSTGLALSIVLFNFGTMAVLDAVSLLNGGLHQSTILVISSVLSFILWSAMISLPVIQAARLTASCNSLRKIGHEIRVRPFGYADIPDQEMDSFLLYTSTLNMRAKLFLVPVHTRVLSAALVTLSFILLLLFQTKVIRFWL